MAAYGLIIVLAGGGLLVWAAALPAWLHRRYPSLPAADGRHHHLHRRPGPSGDAAAGIDRALLGILPVGALTMGVLIGFSERRCARSATRCSPPAR